MRWTAGLFILFATPALAASPQCVMQGPTVITTSAPVTQPPTLPIGAAQPQQGKATALPANLANIAFAQHIASAGAQVSDLGTIHGLQAISARSGSQFMIFELSKDGQAGVSGVPIDLTVAQLQTVASGNVTDVGEAHGFQGYFVRSGQQFQVFYATPDKQGLVPGVMWDAGGKDLTRQQVAQIPGAVPTVEIGGVGPVVRRSRGRNCPCWRRQPTAPRARRQRPWSTCLWTLSACIRSGPFRHSSPMSRRDKSSSLSSRSRFSTTRIMARARGVRWRC